LTTPRDPTTTATLFTPPPAATTVGDLFANVWQYGYVTNDLERAIELMSARLGLERATALSAAGATFLAGDEPAPWEAQIAMGARGGRIVELIEPVAGEVGFYRRFLPADGSFAVRFHHVATLIAGGDEEWERARSLLAASGLRFDFTVTIPDRVRAGYVDTGTELGHLLEVCQLEREDIEFFSALLAGGD
jgi:hypothetical protein